MVPIGRQGYVPASEDPALFVARAALLFLALGIAAGSSPRVASAAEPAGVALDTYFKGQVVGLDGTKVKLRYDFSTPEQMKDWVVGVPWNIAKDAGDGAEVAEGRLAVRGSQGARHAAEWEGDLLVTCRLVPDGVKDIGAYLAGPDNKDDYVTYSIGETYFHSWDKKAGGETGMMKFGKQFSAISGGGYTGFRYLAMRMPETPTTAGKPIAFSFGRSGGKVLMSTDDMKLDSVEPGNRMRVAWPGFYAVKSGMVVDDVVIEGTLSPRWLEAKKVLLKTDKPIEAAAAAPPLDPAVAAILEGYRTGKESPAKVVDLVKDASRSDSDREAAAKVLSAGPRRALPVVVELLYNVDLKARTLGIGIVKALTGKTYGYDPKGGEKARSAAAARLQKDLQDHPELLQGSGG